MRQRRPLYHCVAGVEPNNLPTSGSQIGPTVVEKSAIKLWDRQHPTTFSPVPSWIIALWGRFLYRWIAGIGPRNLRVSYSGLIVWLWWSVEAVAPECGCWALVLWWKECDEKSVSRRVQFEAKCRETTMHYATLESVMAITPFQAEVSWHFCPLNN